MEYIRTKALLLVLAMGMKVNDSHGANEKLVQFRTGDIIIGALAVVHNNEKMVGGTQLIEIINMMVEQINRNTTILPGVTLGSLIIDTRRTSSYTLKQIARSFFPLIAKETQNCNNDSIFTPLPLFAGVIGSSTSGVSMDSAKLLQAFSIPQISYWSTSSELSDKAKFPYFFRTIPSDAEQADAIIEFAAIMEWNYVSFIYEDSAYGISGYEAFVKYAAKKGICVAAGIRMSKVPSSSEVKKAVKSLKDKRRARAVVLYVLSTVVKLIMIQAKSETDIEAGHFLWLVTDTTVGILPGSTVEYAEYESELQSLLIEQFSRVISICDAEREEYGEKVADILYTRSIIDLARYKIVFFCSLTRIRCYPLHFRLNRICTEFYLHAECQGILFKLSNK